MPVTPNLSAFTGNGIRIGNFVASGGSRTPTTLSVAYVHTVTGTAVGWRFQARTAEPINELYVFMDTVVGDIGLITMEAQIYNEGATATQPGSTLRDTSTATAMPDAGDKWIKFTFGTPYTPAVGEVIWLVIYNTATIPLTNHPGIMTSTNSYIGGSVSVSGVGAATAYTTTTGFSTAGTAAIEAPFVLKVGDTYIGQPFTQQNVFFASNTLERGIKFTVPVSTVVSGIEFLVNAAYTTIRILEDSTPPAGAALVSVTTTGINELIGSVTFAPVTLVAGRSYKCTILYSGAATAPNGMIIEDYTSYSAVFDAIRDQDLFSNAIGVIDNGAGGWTTKKDVSPGISLIVNRLLPGTGGFNYY